MEITTKREMGSGEMYCGLCGRNVSRDEEVIGEPSLIPSPYICKECALTVALLVEESWGDELDERRY
ncbi:MAG: hypothetical protein ACTSUO_06055 [Candidatus Thorarchaeota archaeon]